MMDTRQRNSIVIEVDGQRYTGWTKASVKRNIENLCGSFSFTSTASDDFPFPVKMGQNCRIFINNILFLTGWVEKLNERMSKDAHEIIVSGRDRTNDIVDSRLEHVDFNPDSTLKSITEAVLKQLNLTDIQVIDRFNLGKFTAVETDALGVTGFAFIERYAKKRQVLLTTNGDGNIVFERAGTEKMNTVLSTSRNSVGTIKSTNVQYDDTKRFFEYKVVGQENSVSAAYFTKLSQAILAAGITAEVKDTQIRTSRKYVFQPEDNGTTGDNKDRAKWEANYRKSQSMIYNCSVFGFQPIDDDGIWEINKKVRVVDNFANINDTNSTLLVTAIEFKQTPDEGTITTLKLMDKDSFTLKISKPEKDKQDYLQGQGLIKREPQKT